MGHEEEAKRETLELIGERLGPVLRAGVYDHSGCPKCGCQQQGSIAKKFHSGFDRRDQSDVCRVALEHEHGMCQACGFQWLEQVRDASAEERRVPASAIGDTMHTPSRTLQLMGKPGEA